MSDFVTPPRSEKERHGLERFRTWGVGEIIANRWFVHRALPPSNMSIIYFCFDMNLGLPMVIKSLPPQYLRDEIAQKRFIAECEIWIRLGQHPNIVTAHFVELVNAYPHVFVEWVNGKDIYHAGLDTWIGTPTLTLERAIDIVAQVCDGMQHAIQVLSKGKQVFVHRDIKPSNILITNDWIAKLSDFGIAKTRMLTGGPGEQETDIPGTGQGAQSHAQHSQFIGTPPYMSPEHYAGLSFINVQSDIYSLGCILFEMLAGRPVFAADDWNAWQEAHLYRRPPRLSDICSVPRHIDALVASCLAKNPADRPQGFMQLKKRLLSHWPLNLQQEQTQ